MKNLLQVAPLKKLSLTNNSFNFNINNLATHASFIKKKHTPEDKRQHSELYPRP